MLSGNHDEASVSSTVIIHYIKMVVAQCDVTPTGLQLSCSLMVAPSFLFGASTFQIMSAG